MDVIDFLLKKKITKPSSLCTLQISRTLKKQLKARRSEREKQREAEKESCISSLGLWDTRVPVQVFQFNESL